VLAGTKNLMGSTIAEDIQEGETMTSLLKKVQTLIQANLHAMVDSALKANSLAVFDQYVREVEDNLENLEDAVATVGGELKTLRRKKSDLDQRAAELDRNIDIFLREGKLTTMRRCSTARRLNSRI
jgi:phage shock protein A